jgi:hypothetical protein
MVKETDDHESRRRKRYMVIDVNGRRDRWSERLMTEEIDDLKG